MIRYPSAITGGPCRSLAGIENKTLILSPVRCAAQEPCSSWCPYIPSQRQKVMRPTFSVGFLCGIVLQCTLSVFVFNDYWIRIAQIHLFVNYFTGIFFKIYQKKSCKNPSRSV